MPALERQIARGTSRVSGPLSLMSSVRSAVVDAPRPSSSCTVRGNDPDSVGGPAISPLAASSDSPSGSTPVMIDQV